MICMVGLPRSGKSTWVDDHIRLDESRNFQVLCADDIRLGLGTRFDSRLENFVWGVHDTMLLASLERNFDIIIDATNTTFASIQKYKKHADKYDYRFIIIHVDTPFHTCEKRNTGPGAVPQNVMTRMMNQMVSLFESYGWKALKHHIIECPVWSNRELHDTVSKVGLKVGPD